MPFDAPFTLGPFTVDMQGRLLPTDTGQFPAFSLRWRSCGVEVSMARPAVLPDGPGSVGEGMISLHAMAGQVPSTAEGQPIPALARRAAVFAALSALVPLLPAGWRMDLLADHSVRLSAEVALAMPTTATELLSAVTLFLLAAAPYLELLEESGVAAAGMRNT